MIEPIGMEASVYGFGFRASLRKPRAAVSIGSLALENIL